jgi:hypothetical protein
MVEVDPRSTWAMRSWSRCSWVKRSCSRTWAKARQGRRIREEEAIARGIAMCDLKQIKGRKDFLVFFHLVGTFPPTSYYILEWREYITKHTTAYSSVEMIRTENMRSPCCSRDYHDWCLDIFYNVTTYRCSIHLLLPLLLWCINKKMLW